MASNMDETPKETVLRLLGENGENSCKLVVLAGESGIGKTWTAKEISYSAIENNLFKFTLWAFLTEEYDSATPSPNTETLSNTKALSESEVLRASFARQLSLLPVVEEFEVEQEDDAKPEEEKKKQEWNGLQAEISNMLAGKKVLLVVDVIVESKLDEEQIVLGFETLLKLKPSNFKVLITRTQSVSQTTTVVNLEPLPVDYSLELLREKAGPKVFGIAEAEALAKTFVEKFKRLPLAISILGRVLSYFGPDSDSAIRMMKGVIEEATNSSDYNIKQLLQNQYVKLPNSVRSVLMDCNWSGDHFFRECGSVHYNELISYWMFEGLLGNFDSIKKAYEEGHFVLMELIEYQILKTLDDGYVKMDERMLNLGERHRLGFCAAASLGLATVIEEKPAPVTEEKPQLVAVVKSKKTHLFGKITQADGVMKTLCSREKGQKLSTLMVDGNGGSYEELLEILKQENNKELQVLALFHRKMEDLLLHLSETSSKLLFLVLRDCIAPENYISPSLKLKNLIVLEISGTNSLDTIPDEFFHETPHLRSLNLSSLPIESLPPSLYGLTKLEWLVLRGCLRLKNLESVKFMVNLVVLDISNSTSFDLFKDKTFLSNPKLQMLNASNTAIKCIPLVKKLTNLTHLLLSGCKEMDRLRKMETLTSLQVLDLSGSSIFRVLRDQSLENKKDLEIVDFSGTNIKEIPDDISDHRCLYLKGCKQLKELPFIENLARLEVLDVSGTVCLEKIEDSFFEKLKKLRTINLSRTSIETISSLSNVIELRELLLSNCSNLEKLPVLNSLEKLEVLDASGCIALKEIQDLSFDNMTRLQKLDLSDTKIESLPSISNLTDLRQLLLRNCTELKQVPSLDSQLKLKELNLHGVRSFKESGADFLKNIISLEILDLSKTSLGELPSLSRFTNLKKLSLASCQINTVPGLESLTNLEALDLSGTKITFLPPLESFNDLRQLLLRDCYSLHDFINIEILNLFGVSAEELPYGISKLKNLDRLDLPENLPGNKDGQVSEEREEDSDQYLWRIFSLRHENLVSITNVQFRRALKKDPSLWESLFSRFHFLIEPIEENQTFNRDELALLGDYVNIQNHQFSLFRKDRTVEIRGFDHPPKGLNVVLNRTDCLYLVHNTFERWLSSLGAANLKVIKGVWIEGSKEIGTLFHSEENDEIALVGKTLKYLAVSHATKLKSIYDGDVAAFSMLEYLFLNCCPSLSVVFPSSPQNLRVLHIKFCDKLETLFENCTLPNLEELHLHELQKLTKIECQLPSLKTLKIVGCPKIVSVLSSELPANELKILEVNCCERMENLFENGMSELLKLQLLNLKELPKLKSIGCILPSLKTLKIVGCPKIVSVLSSEQPANELRILEVNCCERMENLFENGTSELPKLQSLNLKVLPKLKSIGCILPSLRHIEVWGCPLLSNVASASQLCEDLEILKVSYCDEMVSLFEHEVTNLDYNLKMLKTLHLLGLPKLVKFGAKFPSLAQQNVVINGCPNADSIVAQS